MNRKENPMDIDQLIDGIVDDVHCMDEAADENERELFRMQIKFVIENYQGIALADA